MVSASLASDLLRKGICYGKGFASERDLLREGICFGKVVPGVHSHDYLGKGSRKDLFVLLYNYTALFWLETSVEAESISAYNGY